MTYSALNAVKEGVKILNKLSFVDNPKFEAQLLLSFFLNLDILYLKINPNIEIKNESVVSNFFNAIKLRSKGMPISKIIGIRHFYEDIFYVDKNVLDPRPESELIVEKSLDILKQTNEPKIIDLGAGSGCLILSILKKIPSSFGVAVDISIDAINVLYKNLESFSEISHNLKSRINIKNINWNNLFENKNLESSFDLIISNPPYISSDEIEKLSIEVKNYDPIIALEAGENGTEKYLEIFKIAEFLSKKSGAKLIVEIGINQEFEIIKMSRNFKKIKLLEIIKDLNKINRCIVFDLM